MRAQVVSLMLLGAGAMAAASGWAATRTMELNEIAPAEGPQGAALRYFAHTVARETRGRLRMDIHFGGALGDPETSVENMMFDQLQAFAGNLDYYLPLMIDEVSGLETPFLLPAVGPSRRYLASPLLETARAKVLHSRHIRFLEMTALHTPFHIIASRRLISSAADLGGLRITSSKPLTKTAVRVWQSLGVTYVPALSASAAQIVTSGAADAAIFPDLDAILKSHVLNAAPHLVGIDDCPQVWQISVNESLWAKLDAREQQALSSAARRSAPVFERQWTRAFHARLAQLRARNGVTYAELNAAALRRRVHAAYVDLVAEGSLSPAVLQAADAASRAP